MQPRISRDAKYWKKIKRTYLEEFTTGNTNDKKNDSNIEGYRSSEVRKKK